MEGLSMKEIALSEPFRFLVGPEGRKFTIHSALVAHQSRVLEVLVNGKFSEAVDGCVKWPDIDEEVFTSFWQYLYTGDYDIPNMASDENEGQSIIDESASIEQLYPSEELCAAAEPAPEPEEPEPEPEEPAPEELEPAQEYAVEEAAPAEPVPGHVDEPAHVVETWPSYTSESMSQSYWKSPKMRKRQKMGKRSELWRHFETSYLSPPPAVEEKEATSTVPNNTGNFYHHAKVYILADRYQVDGLMSLSFGKLHQALVQYHLSKDKINDTIELLHLCYGDQDVAPERLRQLAVRYVACHLEQLWTSSHFQQILEEAPLLSKDILTASLARLD